MHVPGGGSPEHAHRWRFTSVCGPTAALSFAWGRHLFFAGRPWFASGFQPQFTRRKTVSLGFEGHPSGNGFAMRGSAAAKADGPVRRHCRGNGVRGATPGLCERSRASLVDAVAGRLSGRCLSDAAQGDRRQSAAETPSGVPQRRWREASQAGGFTSGRLHKREERGSRKEDFGVNV